MTQSVKTNGKEHSLELVDSEQVYRAIAWELNAAALSALSPSEVSPLDTPFIEFRLDGENKRKAYVDFVVVRNREVELVIARITDFGGDDLQTTYYLSLSPDSDGVWKLNANIIFDTHDEQPGFGSLQLHDQLAFFFSE